MKNFFWIFLLAIISCVLIAIAFLGIGILINLFLPVTPFQTALLLMASFCCLMILFPLLLINQKMEEMMLMMEEDYMLWDEEDGMDNRGRLDKKRTRSKQNKIIVMGNSPIIDRDAPCPCGSGKKYKNCCDEKNKPKKNEGE